MWTVTRNSPWSHRGFLGQAGSAVWRHIMMTLWHRDSRLLGWTVLWLVRILLWFEVSAYVVLPKRHMWKQKYFRKWVAIGHAPSPRSSSEGIKGTLMFTTKYLGKAHWKHFRITVFPGQCQDGQLNQNRPIRKPWFYISSSSQQKKVNTKCLHLSSTSRFKKDNLNPVSH